VPAPGGQAHVIDGLGLVGERVVHAGGVAVRAVAVQQARRGGGVERDPHQPGARGGVPLVAVVVPLGLQRVDVALAELARQVVVELAERDVGDARDGDAARGRPAGRGLQRDRRAGVEGRALAGFFTAGNE
jgi:hypothetical protein